MPALPAETAPAALDLRPVPGTVTGRSLDQLFLRRSAAVFVPLTGGPDPVALLSADMASGTATVQRAGGGAPQTVRWRPEPLGDGGAMHLLLAAGQSLTQGHVDSGQPERIPFWRDPVAERAWQFQAGDGIQRGPRPLQVRPVSRNRETVIAPGQLTRLEPLRGARHANDPQYAQTSVETAALALIGQHLHHEDHVLGCVIGTGATAIADFAPGAAHFKSACAVIGAAQAQAAAHHLALRVWLVWNQGEEDNDRGTSQAVWQDTWRAIRDGLRDRTHTVGGVFGGSVIQQTLQRTAGATGMATLAQAELIAAGEALAVMPVTCPPFYSGRSHLRPLTYLPLGAATGYEISRMIAGGTPVTPHVAAGDAVRAAADRIDCRISGGTGRFLFDDTLPCDRARGIRVLDPQGRVLPIRATRLAGADRLALTLAEPAPDVALWVEFGLHGTAANTSRVSIRDDSGWTCPCTGHVVSGWMMHHRVAVTAPPPGKDL